MLLILNYLDRNALASARVQGIEADLGMVGTNFNTAVSVLFVGELAFLCALLYPQPTPDFAPSTTGILTQLFGVDRLHPRSNPLQHDPRPVEAFHLPLHLRVCVGHGLALYWIRQDLVRTIIDPRPPRRRPALTGLAPLPSLPLARFRSQ